MKMKVYYTAYVGYHTAYGYKGLVDGRYMLFANESDYMEYIEGGNEDAED